MDRRDVSDNKWFRVLPTTELTALLLEYQMEVRHSMLWPSCPSYIVSWLLGYLLGMVIDSATQFQSPSSSTHKDPLHVTAHFLRPVSIGPVEIRVRRLRTGQGFTNLTAELVQGVRLVIQAFFVSMLTRRS